MPDKLTQHKGWSVWCCDGCDWIAARCFEDAVSHQSEEMQEPEEEVRGWFDSEPCDLNTMHIRDVLGESEDRCSFLESLKETLASKHAPQYAFKISTTEW